MAADLITRIILDDNKFNDTLNKVKKQMNISGEVAAGFSSALKGVAGSLGLIMGAQETFNKLMQSSQGFGDKMTATMNAAKDSVDTFFTALTTWDSSSFYNGLDNIIRKSLEATAALDQLGNTTISFGYFSSKYDEGMSDAKLIAKNKQLSKGEREQGFSTWEGLTQEKMSAAKVLADETSKAIRANIVKSTHLLADSITQEDLEKVIKIDLLPASERDLMKERAKKDYEEYTEALNKLKRRSNYSNVIGGKILTKEQEANNLAGKYKSAILVNKMLGTDRDEDLQENVNKLASANAALKAAKDNEMERLEAWTEFLNSQKAVKSADAAGAGSIKELDKLIADTKNGIVLSVDPTSRAALYAELKELEERKRVIEFQYKHPEGPGKIEKGDSNLAALAKMPDMKIDKPIEKKDVKVNNDFATSLMTISNIMGSVTNMTNEGAAAWIAWGGNLLASVAAAIPAITSLIGVKSTEAVVNGVASATQTPLIGWLLAGAAAASVIGALMAIPKFATGGIIPGNSTIGDNLLARVNSGEMILNTSQQSNLFNLLNKGGVMGGGRESVELKVKGKDLVAVLGNYSNQRSKIL